MKFNSNKFFKPTRDFNADDVLFSVLRQMDPQHPYHKVSQGIMSTSTTWAWIS
ncbi:hypothetical protein LNP25_25440 [Klebsiella variicola subsp. variicola]|nr:hypothetical protein [Klebsiella variicola subsp. variicola]